jgi:hypothetical protein
MPTDRVDPVMRLSVRRAADSAAHVTQRRGAGPAADQRRPSSSSRRALNFLPAIMATAVVALAAHAPVAQADWVHPRCANGSMDYSTSLMKIARVRSLRREVTNSMNSNTSQFVHLWKERAKKSLAPMDVDPVPWEGPETPGHVAPGGEAFERGVAVCRHHVTGSLFKVGNWECEF